MITVYQIIKEVRKHHHHGRYDRCVIGHKVREAYLLVSGGKNPEKKVLSKEGENEFMVFAYPDEFKPVIINVINQYFKEKKEKQSKTTEIK